MATSSKKKTIKGAAIKTSGRPNAKSGKVGGMPKNPKAIPVLQDPPIIIRPGSLTIEIQSKPGTNRENWLIERPLDPAYPDLRSYGHNKNYTVKSVSYIDAVSGQEILLPPLRYLKIKYQP